MEKSIECSGAKVRKEKYPGNFTSSTWLQAGSPSDVRWGVDDKRGKVLAQRASDSREPDRELRLALTRQDCCTDPMTCGKYWENSRLVCG